MPRNDKKGVIASPSLLVILSVAKNLVPLRVNSAKQSSQFFVQVTPFSVHTINILDLLLSWSGFDLLLP